MHTGEPCVTEGRREPQGLEFKAKSSRRDSGGASHSKKQSNPKTMKTADVRENSPNPQLEIRDFNL